ncbi:MAG: DNA repair protein RecN [Bacteroidaceae bacterium]|nr:DNA repair protein RecN [Bacteroidaceae bacterium]
MLKHISIRNYALIESVEVDFTSGFSVITGETGHGKSVFLGAVSMLLGQRSDVKAIREGADKCIIEGCFDISGFGLQPFFEENEIDYDDECIVRRELTASGRSRVFVNDTPVGVTQLKEIGAKLIDIHSQHQNLLIADKNYQLSVLDTLADDKLLLDRYSKEYNAYLSLVREIERMKEELEKSRRDEEWLRFQMNELESASLKDGELEELEQEVQELSHSEEIQAALYGACNAIDSDERGSLLTALRDASSALSRIASHYGAAEELSERLESNYIELKDCCSEMMQRAERVQFAPDRLEFVERRIALIYDLQKKHRVATVGELIALYNDISARLERISCGDDDIKDAEKQLSALRAGMADIAGELTEKRRQSAERLKNDITAILVNLGMPMIRFEVDMKKTSDFTSNGVDSVNFLFSANSSSAPQPLCDVASGGEMSRVMLALKSLIASQRNQPTLIFDEVDTGVSGVIAERMGRLMQQMGGANRQVLSITHLPQVAALGVNHYKVYKEETEKGTITNMIKLDQQERVREIAQMMSGEQLTDAAIENASLLLSQSK